MVHPTFRILILFGLLRQERQEEARSGGSWTVALGTARYVLILQVYTGVAEVCSYLIP